MTSIVPFLQLADLCVRKGVEDVIICPGSRNAVLTIAFTSNKALKCKSISDERSAGFLALGQAIASQKPTVLICTSGTAALNFHPAVAEAFFQKIPLLLITADRPPEWINQHDGQTVFQPNCYGKHVKKYYEWLPDQSEDSINYAERISNEAFNFCQNGPVHINIPIREPFYPDNVDISYNSWRNIELAKVDNKLSKSEIEEFKRFLLSQNKVLLVGQNRDHELSKIATLFAQKFGFELVGDCISNLVEGIKNQDVLFKTTEEKEQNSLNPDFLISIGASLISKSLKLFLRNNKAETHWHIENDEEITDPFVSITKKIMADPKEILSQLLLLEAPATNLGNWSKLDNRSSKRIDKFFDTDFAYSEFKVVNALLKSIPSGSILYLGNSMSVRYVNAIQKNLPANTEVYCNRGTSGIEGTLSTAVGHAMMTDKPVYCLLGDVSFQYDKNALWNNYLPQNLRIVVLNNAGGVIFQMINGPKKQASFQEFFKTDQKHKAALIAAEFGLSYASINSSEEIFTNLKILNERTIASILEVFSDADTNEKEFKRLFQ